MHISELLQKEFLTPLKISQTKLAHDIGVTKTTVSQILQGKRSITPDTDLRLCRYFNLEEGYFLRIQAEHDLERVKIKIAKDLSGIIPIKPTAKKAIVGRVLKVGVICGGLSMERGISLNSARSIMDHLRQECVEICPIYMDKKGNFYEISQHQLYSNTPSDFDFKLQHTANKLDPEQFKEKLVSVDIVFPAIHGAFGEEWRIAKNT